jgi:hypothetical protein
MIKDYPDAKQRSAIAYSQWRKSKEMHNLNFYFNVPITEKSGDITLDKDFIIEGTAINATVTSNNHRFLEEELRSSASSLNGVPLLVDHKNEIEAIKGRVISGTYMELDKKITFKAKVIDPLMKQMISDGRINSVSVGCAVENCDVEDGFLTPRGIQFKELSLVAVPADEGATFSISLKEAYDTQLKEIEVPLQKIEEEKNIESCVQKIQKEVKKMSEETKIEQKAEITEVIKQDTGVTADKLQSMIKLAVEEAVKSIKQSEVKVEAKAEIKKEIEEDSDLIVEEKGKYKIFQSNGSLRGGSFTVVRA